MPRNSSGDYSLPAGNPVVTGTVISSTWANTTLEDIGDALTDSLSRSGDGGMTAPLLLDPGSAALPGLAFSTDQNTGLYLIGNDDLGITVGGNLTLELTTSAILPLFPLRAQQGTNTAPVFSFSGDTNTGMYSVVADTIQFTTGGTLRLSISTTLVTSTLVHQGPNGSAGTPAYGFTTDTDNGLYLIGANDLGMSVGGTLGMEWVLSGAVAQSLVVNGSAAAVALGFSSDPDTGLYRQGANFLGIAAGGSTIVGVSTTALLLINGTSANPAFSFDADTDTGIYRIAANSFEAVAGSVRAWQWNAASNIPLLQILHNQNGTVGAPSYSFNNEPDTGIYLSSAAPGGVGISCDGVNYLNVTATTTTVTSTQFNVAGPTTGTATGGAATLPANPVGFWTVGIAGTARKVPYYAV